jgi:hypothetical protein
MRCDTNTGDTQTNSPLGKPGKPSKPKPIVVRRPPK